MLHSILTASIFLLSAASDLSASGDGKGKEVECQFSSGACSMIIDGKEVTLDITPKPVKVMKELEFTVTVKGAAKQERMKLRLQMPGMMMGNNEVKLTPAGDGRYSGKGVIPKCPSGRTLWSATLVAPELKLREEPFIFNVQY